MDAQNISRVRFELRTLEAVLKILVGRGVFLSTHGDLPQVIYVLLELMRMGYLPVRDMPYRLNQLEALGFRLGSYTVEEFQMIWNAHAPSNGLPDWQMEPVYTFLLGKAS